jgi:hypothetical protein
MRWITSACLAGASAFFLKGRTGQDRTNGNADDESRRRYGRDDLKQISETRETTGATLASLAPLLLELSASLCKAINFISTFTCNILFIDTSKHRKSVAMLEASSNTTDHRSVYETGSLLDMFAFLELFVGP